jgi:osmotically-inducible protein OsmY
MRDNEDAIKDTLAALEREPKIDLHHFPLKVDFGDGILTLEGSVKDMAAKKLALECAAGVTGVTGIIDRLKVFPAEQMTDEMILEHVRNAFIEESALSQCSIGVRTGDQTIILRQPPANKGAIDIGVEDGNVLLEGAVPSLSHKRLAGVLAWWVPGAQNVLYCLHVQAPEEDTNDEMTDAVRLVLEKDPFLNADQIQVTSRDRRITLNGIVRSKTEAEAAEHDAWCVFGVDKVFNNLEVRP